MWCIVGLLVTLGSVSAAPSPGGCLQACNFILQPVCDADGNMYDNACMRDTPECNDGVQPRVRPCPRILAPVCGSNGKTYDNRCLLEADACLGVTKVSDWECDGAEVQQQQVPRRHHHLQQQQQHVERPGGRRPDDECLDICTMELDQICGTDGQVYANPCQLELARCRSQGAVSSIFCLMNYAPVCGSNGKVYSNQCMLSADSCLGVTRVSDSECEGAEGQQQQVQKRHHHVQHQQQHVERPGGRRPDDECLDICTTQLDQICGTDGQVYANPCKLALATCQSQGAVSSIFCPMNYAPVCGSNGKVYGNQCMLSADSCLGVTSADWSVCESDQNAVVNLLRSVRRQQ